MAIIPICQGQNDMETKRGIKSNKYPQSLIQRTKLLEGRYVYSVICNGGSYFLIDLPIYEDGIVDCWETVDLPRLKEKLKKGWLTPQIPNGEKVSIFHLGSWNISSPKWEHTKDNYYDFIISVIKEMNPKLENLFTSEKTSKVIGNSNYSVFGYSSAQLIRKDSERPNFKIQKGDRIHFFIKQSDNVYELANLNIYPDSILLLDGIENPKTIDLNGLKKLSASKELTTELPIGAKLKIKNLGEFEVTKCNYHADLKNKIAEVSDIINKLNDKPTTSEICYKIYQAYKENPSEELKMKLKEAYENIPTHLRVYVLGDMDAKDWPIRAIIYEE